MGALHDSPMAEENSSYGVLELVPLPATSLVTSSHPSTAAGGSRVDKQKAGGMLFITSQHECE